MVTEVGKSGVIELEHNLRGEVIILQEQVVNLIRVPKEDLKGKKIGRGSTHLVIYNPQLEETPYAIPSITTKVQKISHIITNILKTSPSSCN